MLIMDQKVTTDSVLSELNARARPANSPPSA